MLLLFSLTLVSLYYYHYCYYHFYYYYYRQQKWKQLQESSVVIISFFLNTTIITILLIYLFSYDNNTNTCEYCSSTISFERSYDRLRCCVIRCVLSTCCCIQGYRVFVSIHFKCFKKLRRLITRTVIFIYLFILLQQYGNCEQLP